MLLQLTNLFIIKLTNKIIFQNLEFNIQCQKDYQYYTYIYMFIYISFCMLWNFLRKNLIRFIDNIQLIEYVIVLVIMYYIYILN